MAKTRFGMIKERHAKTFETADRQGKMDPEIRELCAFIAATEKYYTSSSCSGRIILLERKGDRKDQNFFHRRWHRKAGIGELMEGLNEKTEGEVWFKVDPFILHVGCENLADAKQVLATMKEAGVKRGGIIVAEEGKFIIEMQGTEKMEFPAKKNGKLLFTEEQFAEILDEANSLLEKNFARLAKLGKAFKKMPA